MVKEPLQTGKPCLTGDASCGGGVCDLVVKSDCDAPVTCDVFITSSCRSETNTGESRGRKRTTFAPKEQGKLNVAALCTDGDAVRTQVNEMKCQ